MSMSPPDDAVSPWWSRRVACVMLLLMAFLPLLYPTIPPLIDLPGHMGRYAVQLDPAAFAHWYRFRWQVIGNLGVDLLIEPMSRLFGLEIAVKLIVMSIPVMTVAGFLWIAREVHGRVPPTAFFALPLAWGHPFIFGFVNYSLSMALALLAFALWLRMGRLNDLKRRSYIFAVIAIVVWITHTFGWGVLGLLCFTAELCRLRDGGLEWRAAAVKAARACMPMALPLIAIIIWRSGDTEGASGWFNWHVKALWVATALRDRWSVFDILSVSLLLMLCISPLITSRFSFSRILGLCAIVLLFVFAILPNKIFGSAYADMRLVPFVLAIAILSIKPERGASRAVLQITAICGLSFYGARVAANTASFALSSARYDNALGALNQVPEGARVVTFVMRSCDLVKWSTNRMEHISGMIMVRRRGFSNDQWQVPGANLMTIVKSDAAFFNQDASQLVVPHRCQPAREWMGLDEALTRLPRPAFDYLWLVDIPQHNPKLTQGMTRVWTDGPDQLYRINH